MRILKLLLILFLTPLLAEDLLQLETDLITGVSQEEEKDKKPVNESEHIEKIAKEAPILLPEDSSGVLSDVRKATESYETAFVKTIVVLVGLLLLVVLTIWMFRKISHGRLRGMNVLKSVKVLEKRPLSPKSMLYLIEVGGKQVLIAESQLEVRNVATLDWLGNDKDL